jgi:hypothetical protein
MALRERRIESKGAWDHSDADTSGTRFPEETSVLVHIIELSRSHASSGGLRLSQRRLLESLHRLFKRSNLGRNRLVLAPQSLDTRQLNFDRLLTRAELLKRVLKHGQGLMGVVVAGLWCVHCQPHWLFRDGLRRRWCFSKLNGRRQLDRQQTPIFPCLRLRRNWAGGFHQSIRILVPFPVLFWVPGSNVGG